MGKQRKRSGKPPSKAASKTPTTTGAPDVAGTGISSATEREPSAAAPPGPEAIAEKPGAGKPVAKPGAEKPGAEKPGADEKPGANEPGADKPGADKPVAGKAVAEKPAKSKAAPKLPTRPHVADVSSSVGQRRRAAARIQREVRAREAPLAGPAESPEFFFGFEVAWSKLVLARVLFFALLALDSLLQISHAPRYGAGGFNVAQLPGFDLIAPGRELYSVASMANAYLLVLAMCGVATRVVVPIATVIYGWLYFSSHLDSYQHHYLVWLLLVLACFVPWQRPDGANPATRVRSWAVRLILIQLAILYLWAAISKMNPAWLDGRTLSLQMSGSVKDLIVKTVGFAWASRLVIVVELVLAATIWHRRGWLIAAPLGLAMHITILRTGLDIGLFAWLMIALYVLVLPDRLWVWLAEHGPIRRVRTALGVVRHWFDSSARFAVWAVAAMAAAVLAMLSRFDDGPAVGLGLVMALLVGTVFAVLRQRTHVAWLAIAHLLAFVMWTGVDRGTSTASDYYRLWGGSSRRLGDIKTAEQAYREMTQVSPNDAQGFYQLGRLLLAREAGEEGLAALRRAQDLEPLRARAYIAEAKWLSTHGRRDEAIAKAREATIVEPNDAEARALLNSLQK